MNQPTRRHDVRINGENEQSELIDHSSHEEETERSPKTVASLANIARRREARANVIEEIRAKQVPESVEEVGDLSPRLAAAIQRQPPRAQRRAAESSRSSPIALIYLRVSTKEQAQRGGNAEGYSIHTQRSACYLKSEQLGATVANEYVDAGESARSAKRDDLQRMLRDVKRLRPDFVIIHKIDRLARNREDDLAINLLLRRYGVKLVSCMEHIDDSPSGRLLYGVMAEIAQFYSANLAEEVMKGLIAKAEEGGTPYRAPIGYTNRREMRGGIERSWVELDEDRWDIIRWCFDEYSTGEWSGIDLTLAAQAKGLTTRPTRTKPAAPISLTTMYHILQNPYYIGIVSYRGIHYEGRHKAIVEPEKWLAVQDILAAHNNTGEKDRKHNHYLRSTIHCSECGGRLVYSEAKGNGGKYIYFMCSKKKTKVNHCQRPAVRVERIEEGILRFYEGFQVKPEAAALIQAGVEWSLEAQREDAERTTKRAKARRASVEAERQVLLRAHYADAVPQDLLASEMQRFTRELAEADGQLRAAQVATTDVLSTLQLSLRAATRCESEYAWAPNQIRRQINRGFFKSLRIGEDGSVERYELNEPFKSLLAVQGPPLGKTAPAEAEPGIVPAEAVDGSDAGATAERATPSVVLQASFPENDVTDSKNNNTHRRWFSTVRGLNDAYLVGATGIEPATARV
ncbi:recombinase family protein [Lentzea sp. BCCO 10_0856]|uniref:Recombinase family protein n=1 Tax=Lentzea miocenica TaxID=3095431 RepID=A0ABU4TH62_9PSEU|nr:recombinase family protein [Lentzea sp. BCCO 10_0856]MDX8037481.1 recombinase family protein [Lentzea sp. BCCO 10_0856]